MVHRIFRLAKSMQDSIIATGANFLFSSAQVEFDIEDWETLSVSTQNVITALANTNNFQFDHDQE